MNINNIKIVPENIIREAAEYLAEEDKNNSFSWALERGSVFKKNELCPVYIVNTETMSLLVTSKERLSNATIFN